MGGRGFKSRSGKTFFQTFTLDYLGCALSGFLSLSLSLYIYIYIYIYTYMQLDIALWCKNQIEHSIWDESSLFCNCACSLEYSSLSTLAGLSYHNCGKLEVAFKA